MRRLPHGRTDVTEMDGRRPDGAPRHSPSRRRPARGRQITVPGSYGAQARCAEAEGERQRRKSDLRPRGVPSLTLTWWRAPQPCTRSYSCKYASTAIGCLPLHRSTFSARLRERLCYVCMSTGVRPPLRSHLSGTSAQSESDVALCADSLAHMVSTFTPPG